MMRPSTTTLCSVGSPRASISGVANLLVSIDRRYPVSKFSELCTPVRTVRWAPQGIPGGEVLVEPADDRHRHLEAVAAAVAAAGVDPLGDADHVPGLEPRSDVAEVLGGLLQGGVPAPGRSRCSRTCCIRTRRRPAQRRAETALRRTGLPRATEGVGLTGSWVLPFLETGPCQGLDYRCEAPFPTQDSSLRKYV